MRSRKHRRDDDWFDDDYHDGQIGAILRWRAELPANIDDATFVPLLEVMVKPFDEFLSPEQMEELWEWAYVMLRVAQGG